MSIALTDIGQDRAGVAQPAQLTLFDVQDLAEILPGLPGERLVACMNPFDDSFSYARNQDSITAEAKLDGIYVLRTSVEPGDLDSGEVVSSYKALAHVERAFRAFNTEDPRTQSWPARRTAATAGHRVTAPRPAIALS